jgi:hypothetical protein
MRNKIILENSTNLWRALVVVVGGCGTITTAALSSCTTTDYNSTRISKSAHIHHHQKEDPSCDRQYLKEEGEGQQSNSHVHCGKQSHLRTSEAYLERKQPERPTSESLTAFPFSSLSKRRDSNSSTSVLPLTTFARAPRGHDALTDDPTAMAFSTVAAQQQQQKYKIVDYDFVVVGNGNAGNAAVETLQQQCPGATIALVDPLRRPPRTASSASSSRQQQHLDYYATFATGLDPHNRIVKLLESHHDSSSHDATFERQRGGAVKTSANATSTANTTTTCAPPNVRLRYRHAILLATGNHGAPPPVYLIDPNAQSRIMELRPSFRPFVSKVGAGGESSSDAPIGQLRPFVPAMRVRELAVEAAARGETVGVLGSGWDAIDLAVEVASAAVGTAAAATSTMASPPPSPPWMIYGSAGPASHILPNYLSAAVAKRLRSRKAASTAEGRVRILDRTLIRYINLEEDKKNKAHIQMYTAKSHDFLDTQRINVDLLVITGDGNAVLPTEDIPKSLRESSLRGSAEGRHWYKSWSQLTYDDENSETGASSSNTSRDKLLLCYKDDGRIVVNPEFSACTGVFAAGSAAKCGNSLTGHTNVAGMGAVDGPASGRVAATNMSRSFYNKGRGLFSQTTSTHRIASKDPVPIWRSDFLSYDVNQRTVSSLASVGIHALCVGHCDSERYSTHGVWWTNLAAQKRLLARQQQDEEDIQEKGVTVQGRDRSAKQRRRRVGKKASHPVYGLGIVFYLDRTGKIQGVMTWGLPFSDNDLQLNNDLVQRMKEIIVRSNISGGYIYSPSAPFSLGSESQMHMSDQLTLQSRRLLATAFSSLADQVQVFPKPLHRYTEVRPPRVRSVGVLKRNDDGHGQGVLGEDMFYGQTSSMGQEDRSPVPMKPIAGVGFASPQAGTLVESPATDDETPSLYAQRRNSVRTKNVSYQTVQNMHNFYLHEHREKQFDDNEALARPPKEEPLWIRKGDERRQTNAAESRSASLRAAFGA